MKTLTKKRRITNLLLIFGVFLVIFTLTFPNYFNQGSFFIKEKIKTIPVLKVFAGFPALPGKGFKLGLDLLGGSHLVYQADLSKVVEDEQAEAMEGLRDVIERRVNLFGVSEPVVTVQEAQGTYRLNVELAGVLDIKEAIKQIGKTPYLEFKTQKSEEESQAILKRIEELNQKAETDLTLDEKVEKITLETGDPFFNSTDLTGRYLKKAEVGFEQNGIEPIVLIEFDSEGAKIFETLTGENVGKRIAIYIDNSPISAPVVNEAIASGKAQISGGFTIDQAKDLSRNLSAGALPVPIELISQNTVGPTLGKISLLKSLRAAIFAFLLIALFMLCFYRLNGLLSVIALLLYGLVLLFLFKYIPITLTLAGIGGALLSVGMAVDANVLIFERFKEERKKEDNFLKNIEEAFKRAWPSIRDSNLTTLIIALIMFSFGASFVKGFALTLAIGIMVSMLTSMFITRMLMQALTVNSSKFKVQS
ncbi:protein translocase subunit SecD [Candidatus Parcubacteria bacterium]|nr:protein translocase subunit SecD [Candidatus Parcubacteria bacterium]